MKNDTFKFLNFSFTTSEAIKIIKDINENIPEIKRHCNLEVFSSNIEDCYFAIEWEDYIYNYFLDLEDLLCKNEDDIEYFKNVDIAINAMSRYSNIQREELLREIQRNFIEYREYIERDKLEDLLENDDIFIDKLHLIVDFEEATIDDNNFEINWKGYGYQDIKGKLVRANNLVEFPPEDVGKLRDSLLKYLLNEAIDCIRYGFKNLTKNDTEVNPSTLTCKQKQDAFSTSIDKFIEQYSQQPKELKCVLIPYNTTQVKEYIEATKEMIISDDRADSDLLEKIFKEYKRDAQERIYNYSLFAFLYYAYGMYISFEHLYNSDLLKLLGAYTFKKDRDKPLLKPTHKNLLQQHKEACILSQYDVNIYLENFISFIQQADTKLKERYVLSYLVDLSHELTASKEYLNRLKNTPYNFSKVSYQDLPQPIKTLLLPIKTLQSA